MSELPEFHNVEAVKRCVKKQIGVIAQVRATLNSERIVLEAIRTMCPHEYSKRYSCGRDAGNKCDICEGWQ